MSQTIETPPKHFDAAQQQIWAELISLSAPGTLHPSDRFILELAVMLLIRCRGSDARRGDFTQAESVLCKCGLTPRSRKRIMAATTRQAAKRRAN